MKRKRLRYVSDLMIAYSIIFKLTLLVSSVIANSPPDTFYLSHKILHQIPAEASSPSAPITNSNTLNRRSAAIAYERSNYRLSPMSSAGESSPVAGVSNNGASDDDSGVENLNSEHDESADNYQEVPDRNMFIDHHNSQLQAMHDLFERRQLNNHQLQSSQELNPISIGLDPVSGGSPFNLPPFPVPNHDGRPVPHSKAMANADNLDQGLNPSLPFGLNPLPHLLGFQNPPFDGPQRGDQSAHSNLRASLPVQDSDSSGSQKVWPKIFRFTDGRINLSDFERQKKIKLSSKNQHNNENHIESAPIMFDGRQLKRKSFLILHGGIFS